jgi:hypothetical protein
MFVESDIVVQKLFKKAFITQKKNGFKIMAVLFSILYFYLLP